MGNLETFRPQQKPKVVRTFFLNDNYITEVYKNENIVLTHSM